MSIQALTRPHRTIVTHVVVLALLTTLTNAAALAPGIFANGMAVLPLAAITLGAASFEAFVRSRAIRGMHLEGGLARDREMLWMHRWACMLAACVSIVCAVVTLL